LRVTILPAVSFARAQRVIRVLEWSRKALRYFTKARAGGAQHDRPMPPNRIDVLRRSTALRAVLHLVAALRVTQLCARR